MFPSYSSAKNHTAFFSVQCNDFRTVNVFAVGPFLLMFVIFVGNFSLCIVLNHNGEFAQKFD